MDDNNTQSEGMLKVGTKLSGSRYTIKRYLASGGFGNTYIATDETFNETVAIKELFIKGICGRNADTREVTISLTENQRTFSAHKEKFRKEARRLRQLSNPHIVRVLDLFDENGTSYYVMNFVKGESLSSRLKRTQTPMEESEVMGILPQILDALACIHAEGIWHLDLKPANIMLDHKNNIILIDFGASKQLKNANGESLSTSTAMAYTPGYAPSEQMEQSMDKFGAWTDLYALGATMFNLLTMQRPPSPSDIEEDAREALKMPPNVSKNTQQLIIWLMRPNRKKRPQDVAEVMKRIKENEPPVINVETEDTVPNPSVDHENSDIRGQEAIHESPSPDTNPIITWSMLRTLVITVVTLVCFGAGMILFNLPDNPKDIFGVKNVTDYPMLVDSGPKNMRQYLYTGELVDTIGALPNGKGIAKFSKYDNIPASTYTGEFVNGMCEDHTGNATQIFDSGDQFIGTFENGFYVKGKYILSDKSYFEGTFKNGSAYNGKWYNADGSFSAQVVNGKERSAQELTAIRKRQKTSPSDMAESIPKADSLKITHTITDSPYTVEKVGKDY